MLARRLDESCVKVVIVKLLHPLTTRSPECFNPENRARAVGIRK